MDLFQISYLAEEAFYYLINNSDQYVFFVGVMIMSLHWFIRRRWLRAFFYFFLGLIWIGYWQSIIFYLRGLGVDSFHEIGSFELKEALFWAKTFWHQLSFMLEPKKIILYSLVTIMAIAFLYMLFYIFRVNNNKCLKQMAIISIALISIGLFQNFSQVVIHIIKNNQSFIEVKSNFSSLSPPAIANPKLNVLLYIGESTSIMNMGIYGYPRTTTPHLSQLEKEAGFIKFNNIFSTHTHTSPSLLEALSIDLGSTNGIYPINQRYRVSVVDVLEKADISTELFSNQGATGAWNLASSIIFANAKRTFSNERSIFLGNQEVHADKPWDHEFLSESISLDKLDSSQKSMIVFHSYAGHGDYLENIPERFRNPIDSYFKEMKPSAITGNVYSLSSVEAYDSTIGYIDYSISEALRLVKRSNKPWVFIYFSDHGESVFSNRAHDSSQFIHEMARVPFIMFFNDAARGVAPDLFDKYTGLAKNRMITTLAQLPSTLFDLFNLAISIDVPPVIGSSSVPAPILVRSTPEGITAVNLSIEKLPDELIDKTDSATAHFVVSKLYELNGPSICYHRSNTLAKSLRGSLVASCLEIDIVVESDGSILAYHPPARNTGLALEQIFFALEKNDKLSFWLDGKNLASGETCNSLLDFLSSKNHDESQILIEFPSGSFFVASQIRSCVDKLKALELANLSYYVPTKEATACSNFLKNGKEFDLARPCQELKEDLTAAKESNLFTDLSFDYGGIAAIEALSFSSEFEWNTWNVAPSELQSIVPSRFRMVILTNDDPNNL